MERARQSDRHCYAPDRGYPALSCQELFGDTENAPRCGCKVVSRLGYCDGCGVYRREYDQGARLGLPKPSQEGVR